MTKYLAVPASSPGMEYRLPAGTAVALFPPSTIYHAVRTAQGGTIVRATVDGVPMTSHLTACKRPWAGWQDDKPLTFLAAVLPLKMLNLDALQPCRRCFR